MVRHNLSRQVFTTDPTKVRRTLEMFVHERDDTSSLDLFDRDDSEFVGPNSPFAMPNQPCDLDSKVCDTYRKEVIRVVHDQAHELRRHMQEFGKDFERRANDTLHLLLNDSEEKINAEKDRYGLQKKEGMFSWLVGADYSMNNPADLTEAAKALLQSFLNVKVSTDALHGCVEQGGTSPIGGTEGMCGPDQKEHLEADVKAREQEYSVLRKQKEASNPILITFDLDPRKDTTHGKLATLSADSGADKSAMLTKEIEEKLANIKTTRDYAIKHNDVIWKLPSVIGVTQKLPDMTGYEHLKDQGLQKIAIDEAQTRTVVADLVSGAALAAVAIGLGMIAGPLGAAGMTGLAAAATATDAGIGVALMLGAINEFEFEQAATNTDLDAQARSISQEAPSLFWLALNIVATAVQLKAAAAQFKEFAQLSKAGTAMKISKNEPEAQKLLGDLQKKGEDFKPGVGDRLRREAEELGTSAAHDAGEISANMQNAVKSTAPGYTHEIPMADGTFWRRSGDGHWCFFASPPRCPLDLMDYMVMSPWISGLDMETRAALMSNRALMKLVTGNPIAGELLEKYGIKGLKAMRQAPFHGADPLEILQRFDKLNGRIKGAEQLLADLAAGESTTRGAIGEITYIEMLLEDGYEIERVAHWVNGQKAADIILKDGTVIDVKFYDWTSWVWKVESKVESASTKMVRQVTLRKQQYPGAGIVYVFAGPKDAIPPLVVKQLEKAGAKVLGTY